MFKITESIVYTQYTFFNVIHLLEVLSNLCSLNWTQAFPLVPTRQKTSLSPGYDHTKYMGHSSRTEYSYRHLLYWVNASRLMFTWSPYETINSVRLQSNPSLLTGLNEELVRKSTEAGQTGFPVSVKWFHRKIYILHMLPGKKNIINGVEKLLLYAFE